MHLLLYLTENPEDRADALAWYARDIHAWINDWAWTFDPRLKDPWPRRQPLILWPAQRQMVDFVLSCVEEDENGLIKKARDVGATWVMALIAVHKFIFEEDSAITFGSRKQELVDKKGDPKTIFSKIRDLLDALPVWMLPRGYDDREHDNFLRIINPANGSTITGEAGDEMGRGGRSTIYFLDEFAFVARAEKVDAAVNDNSNCVVYLSTVNGIGTVFYRKEKAGSQPVFYHTWKDDPRKNEAWKKKKIRETSRTTFAQEHELDDGASLDNVIIPANWVMCAVGLRLAPEGEHAIGLDVADEGADSNVLMRRQGPRLVEIDAWQEVMGHDGKLRAALSTDTGRKAIEACERHSVERLHYDRVGIGSGVAGVLAERRRKFHHWGVVANEAPSSICYPDDPNKPARLRFANRTTEQWWALRTRFEKTYKHVNGIESFPEDELIALPAYEDFPVGSKQYKWLQSLISQLSSRLMQRNETGKTRLESKKDMKRRGIKSPDFADSLVLCFAPPGAPPVQQGGVIKTRHKPKAARLKRYI